MIDFIIFSVLIAIAAVLGKLLGKEVTKSGFTEWFVKGRPLFRSRVHLNRFTTWNGSPVRKLPVKEALSYPTFTGTVSPRALRCYMQRNKLNAVVITHAQVS